MHTGLAIMVKTPGHSPVKTRLAADTGPDFADEWHGRVADCVCKIASKCRDVALYWAVAELSAFTTGAWRGLPCMLQGHGDMGQRMANVHRQLMAKHEAGILIGADVPQLTREMLSRAVDWLRAPEPRLVFGPVRGGGFWLFGANRDLPPDAWRTSPASRTASERSLRAAMAGRGRWLELPALCDLDEITHLGDVVREMSDLQNPTPEQLSLLAWLCLHPFHLLDDGVHALGT